MGELGKVGTVQGPAEVVRGTPWKHATLLSLVVRRGATSAQGLGSLAGLMTSGTGQGASLGMALHVTLSPITLPAGGSTNSTTLPALAHSTMPSEANPFIVLGFKLHT
jgi:hypothetical protein